MASWPFVTLMFTAACAPLLFYAYWRSGLVCAPRAIAAASIFGVVPLALTTAGVLLRKRALLHAAVAVLVVEIIITPIIMLGRLGWDRMLHDRLAAFLTFEAIAAGQIVLVVRIAGAAWKHGRQRAS